MPTVSNYLDTYASWHGVNLHSSYSFTTHEGADVISQVNDGYPCIILLQNHYRYGDHYVVALGYKQYTYSSGESNYIRIADGWTNKATRFVWGQCSGRWYMIKYRP